MPPRSVSELLPRRFEDLDLDDVRRILDDIGDTRETLFFEKKSQPNRPAIAKACAAFANTYGGLLLVGAADDSDALVGIEPVAEPQLWVKDTLGGHMLPLPPFRARWLDLDDGSGKGVLLVLVEESSTTPHLLRRNGAIYVRSPSSSDPVTAISDQQTLFELTRRGIAARERATARATERSAEAVEPLTPLRLGFAATGMAEPDVVHSLYRGTIAREEALAAATNASAGAGRTDTLLAWELHRLIVRRYTDRGVTREPPALIDVLIVESDGSVALHRAWAASLHASEPVERYGPLSVDVEEDVVPWFSAALEAARRFLLNVGAHGDLFVRLQLDVEGRHVHHAKSRAVKATRSIAVTWWLPLDADAEKDAALADDLRAAIRRALGVPAADG